MTADPVDVICISDEEEDKEAFVPATIDQDVAKFPKHLGSFQTRGVIITSCSSKLIAAGAQLIFPLRQKKEAPKLKKRKMSLDDGAIRFLVSENPESYKGLYPPPLGHYDRNRLEIGKLDLAISRILLPLLANHFIAISAVIVHAPPKIGLSSALDIQLHVFILPKLFMSTSSQISDVSDELQYDPEAHIRSQFFNLLQLLEGASVEHVYSGYRREAENAKFRLEALYESIEVEHQQLPEAPSPPRLKCTLRPYQKQALYWLLCREKSIEEAPSNTGDRIDPQWQRHSFPDKTFFYSNRSTLSFSLEVPYLRPKSCGGILGDEMGMGKTVEMIALMASDTPNYEVDEEVDYIKATLVICPMSLLSQWESEVQQHSELRVAVFYGNERDFDRDDFDVLITTYGTVKSEFKNAESSLLFTPTWDRVILDEAHNIKNKSTSTAKSVFALNSRARFAVTGTPIQNNLGDLFSLFHFLREEPWSKYSWWRSQIEIPYEQNNPIAMQRLKAILHPLFLRRCKTSKDLNGKPLLDLPPREDRIVDITLSPEERSLYDALFSQSQTAVNGLLQSGAFAKHTSNILEMILRLRQCCNHPLLALGYTPDGGAKQYEDAVSRLLRHLKSKIDGDGDSEEQKLSQNYVENLSSELKSGDGAGLECPICLEDPLDPVFTRCGHIMCRECSAVLFVKKKLVLCPICREPIRRHQLLNGFARASDIDLSKEFRDSSKTKRLLSEIAELHAADPESKTVVFSQWASMLDIVEKALSQENLLYLRLDGSLSQRNRERVLKQFTSPDSEYRILLCSLKVGGVGLNLVAASNVILLDIWWNPAVDAQAIDRIHRIGQTKPVKVRRFVVAQSIETRILELQNKKTALAHGALHSTENYDDLTKRQQDIVQLFEGFT